MKVAMILMLITLLSSVIILSITAWMIHCTFAALEIYALSPQTLVTYTKGKYECSQTNLASYGIDTLCVLHFHDAPMPLEQMLQKHNQYTYLGQLILVNLYK